MSTTHPSMTRFYAALRDAGHSAGQSEVARDLDMTPQRVSNWESRGISQEGALEAQRRWGINAVWLLDGVGPAFIGGTSQSGRPDFGKIGNVVNVLWNYLRIASDTRHVKDPVMLETAWEVVDAFGEAVTPTNVIEMAGRLGEVLKGTGTGDEQRSVRGTGDPLGEAGSRTGRRVAKAGA